MDALNYLYQVLEDKIANQCFYNECLVKLTNPAARKLFTSLRDEEMAHISALQKEIAAIEARPFPVNVLFPKLRM
jgi:rubrerythrin